MKKLLITNQIMTLEIPYIIYLIGVLALITPAFLANNSSTKTFFKNVAIWGIILLIIIFIYQAFVIERW